MAATRMRACVVAVTALAVAVLAVAATAQTPRLGSTDVPEMLRERGIVGYADRLSVQPGETIRFMVSSELPRYRADVVRLIHGDANPNGPGFKEAEIDTPVSGEYDGRRQELPFGSYVLVPDNPALRLRGSAISTAAGGRLMYMGGNGFYWITSLDSTGRFIEVRREHGTEHWQGAPGETYHATTGEFGGLWRFRGRAPQRLVGVGFTAQGFDRNSPFRRTPGSFDPRAAFIFEGLDENALIGEHPSLVLEVGAAGSELDRVDYAQGSPTHTLILATSFGHSDSYQHVVEEVNTSDSRQGGTENVLVKADMAYLEYPNGGAVFSTSSIAWSGSLSYNGYDNDVSRITENVLRRFAADEPIPWPDGSDSDAVP